MLVPVSNSHPESRVIPVSMSAHSGRLLRAPERVAVFRALQLGDMLCAVPALRALRAAWPGARITLIGLPSAAGFQWRFRRYVDDFIAFPGDPAFPEQAADMESLPAFYAAARAQNFDLAIQLHGSGEQSNRIVRALGARRCAGFHPVDDLAPEDDEDLFMPWPSNLNEIHRYLALMRFLGVAPQGQHLELPVEPGDEEEWAALADSHGLVPHDYVCIHPGARMLSRRWPVERFAALADHFVQQGMTVVLTGAAEEQPLHAHIIDLVGNIRGSGRLLGLGGRTGLGALALAIGRSRLLICNDTGVSHVAAAMKAPSVVVACGSDTQRWRPLDEERHRVLAHMTQCRPCMYQSCPFDHPCATAIGVDAVLAQAYQLMRGEAHVC